MLMRPHGNAYRNVHAIFCVLLVVFVAIGIRVSGDYGVSIDEYSQIELGRVNYSRIVSGSQELYGNEDKYYGPAFETVLYGISQVTSTYTNIPQLATRRLVSFLFFAAAAAAWYALLFRIFGNPWSALTGAILLITSPRFFAESFYNSKDVAFLSVTIFLWYVAERAMRSGWKSLIGASLVTGFAIAVRPQGLLLMAAVAATLWAVRRAAAGGWRYPAVYVAGSLCAAYAYFPVFWQQPLQHLQGYFQSTLNPIGVPTRYFGTVYISPNIPWHHLLVWMGITNLLSVVVLFLGGIGWFATRIGRQKSRESVILGAMGVAFVGSVAAPYALHMRTYDGWRHLYYLYPVMVAFCIYFLRRLTAFSRSNRSGRILLIIIYACLLFDVGTAVRFMVRNHPNEYVYFNALAGGYPKAKANFDFDYWGISYKQLFAYLMTRPGDTPTTIYFEEMFPYVRFAMMPHLTARGYRIVDDPRDADLYVVINRDFRTAPGPAFQKMFAVTVEGADLSAVYSAERYRERLRTSPEGSTLLP
jgi:hypothetical protein